MTMPQNIREKVEVEAGKAAQKFQQQQRVHNSVYRFYYEGFISGAEYHNQLLLSEDLEFDEVSSAMDFEQFINNHPRKDFTSYEARYLHSWWREGRKSQFNQTKTQVVAMRSERDTFKHEFKMLQETSRLQIESLQKENDQLEMLCTNREVQIEKLQSKIKELENGK